MFIIGLLISYGRFVNRREKSDHLVSTITKRVAVIMAVVMVVAIVLVMGLVMVVAMVSVMAVVL